MTTASEEKTREHEAKKTPPEQASPDYDHPKENVADLERPPVLSPTKARQGIELHEMRYVLLFGTVLAILALAVIYFVFV